MLVITGSQSNAFKLIEMMKRNKIPGKLTAAPRQYANDGCSYGVKFDSTYREKVSELCKKGGIKANFV